MILVILRAWNHPCDSREKNHKNAIFCPQNVILVAALKIRRWCQKLLYISGVMWLVMTANLVPIIHAIFEKFAHMWQKSRFLTHFWTFFLGDFWSDTTQGTSMGRARIHFRGSWTIQGPFQAMNEVTAFFFLPPHKSGSRQLRFFYVFFAWPVTNVITDDH